jgi:hypothetical protein
MRDEQDAVPSGLPDESAPEPPPLGPPDGDPEGEGETPRGPDAMPGIPTEGEPPAAS